MKFEVKNRFTGVVQFECELTAEVAGQEYSLQLGFAVKKAIEARANLAGAFLARANLAGANLADADLARANLAGAFLARANLAGANLAGANLAGADLAGANLADADLAGANLADANLAGADLARANLAGAFLARANLADASGVIDAGTPNGWKCYGWLRDGYLSIRCGCREKRLDEAREYWSESHDEYEHRREVVAALTYIETVATLRGWPITAPAAKSEAA